jgi:signal transduction histidine kinase
VRTKIVRLTVLASLLATALLGIPLAIAVARYLITAEHRELRQVADHATLTVSADLVNGHDTVELPPTEAGTTLGIYNTAGKLIAGQGPARADAAVSALLPGAPRAGTDGGSFVVAVPAVNNEQIIAVVRAATPRPIIYDRIALDWLAMASLGIAAVATSWVLARRQARHLARPLEDLSVSAQRLGDGDFSIRTAPSDIPEIAAAAIALNTTAARLDTLLARERAFSSEASHQLRTPLTGLQLTLEAALDASDATTMREAINQAITSTDRLEQTIDDLLALSRDTPRRREQLDLPALLAVINKHWAGGPERPLRIDAQPNLPVTHASTPAVRQILGVLLDNALRHGDGQATLTAREAAGALALSVTDQGAGITLDNGELFQRRTSPGHGIGLAMARRLAEAEGGRLDLTRPAPPTFTLLLPGSS